MLTFNSAKYAAIAGVLLSTTALTVPTPVMAADASAGPAAMGLEEVVVTARKRVEHVQDVPIAISVTNAEQLKNKAITQVGELGRGTPLSIKPSSVTPMAVTLAMRGQSLTDIRLNQDLAIGVYQDGVYLPRAQGANASDLYDLDRVEVLAGPQGTLYGKNTTGGVLHIFTHLPTNELEASAQLRFGSFGSVAVNTMANVPVNDKFAVRTVVSYNHRDGLGTNLLNNQPLGAIEAYSLRATAQYKASDALTATVRGNYIFSRTSGFAGKGGTLSPTFVGGNPDDGSMNTHPVERDKVWGLSLTLDADLGNDLSLKSITAGNGFNRRGTSDIGGAPTNFLDYPDIRVTDRQLSQEFQVLGTAFNGASKWITGVFLADEQGTERNVQVTSATQLQLASDNNKSFGIFAQDTHKITDKLSLTAGVRYSIDKKHIVNNLQTTAPTTLCQALGLPIGATTIPGAQVTAADCVRHEDVRFDGFSYTASLDYHFTPDVMGYVKTSRGYRAGGLQQTGGFTPAGTCVTAPSVANCLTYVNGANTAFAPYRPEKLTDYEIGVKADLFDRRARVNLAYYHSNLKDAIRSAPTATPAGIASFIQNAASIRNDGVEWQVNVQPIEQLELYTTGSWMHARFLRYVTPTGVDQTGIDVLLSPKWQYGFGAALTLDVGIGSLRTQVDYDWQDRALVTETAAYSAPHGILNLRTGLTLEKADMEVAFSVKNLGDVRYFPANAQVGAGVFVNNYYSPPRMFFVEVSKKF